MHQFTCDPLPDPVHRRENNITSQRPGFGSNGIPLLPHLTRNVNQPGLPNLHRTFHIVHSERIHGPQPPSILPPFPQNRNRRRLRSILLHLRIR